MDVLGIVKKDAPDLGEGKRAVRTEALEGSGADMEHFHDLGTFEPFLFDDPGTLGIEQLPYFFQKLGLKLKKVVGGNNRCRHNRTVLMERDYHRFIFNR